MMNLNSFLASFSLFSVITSLGAVLGLLLSTWRAPDRKKVLLDLGIGAVLGGLIGARLGYAFLNWGYFQSHILEIPQVWLGGLTWPGAFLGGAIALGLGALITRQSPGMIADRLLPLIGLLSASAWLACWTAGCVYGPQTGAWWGVPVVDEYGEMAARVPLSILGAVLSLGVTAAVMFWPEASWLKHTGRRAALGIGGITAVNFLLSLFRVDPAPVWWVLRWDSWFGLAFTMIALGVFFGLPHLSGTEGELSSS